MDKKAVLKHIDSDYVVSLTQKLIRIPSESPAIHDRSKDRAPIVRFIVDEFKSMGLSPELVTILEGRPNIALWIEGSKPGPRYMLYTHCDTGVVPDNELPDWQHDPFGGQIIDGRLYGRGAADTKGGVAGIIAATRAIVESGVKFRGTLLILISTSSEAGSPGGVVDMVKKGMLGNGRFATDGAIVADCSNRQIVRYFKGRVWHQFTVRGKAVHACEPHVGINAVEKACNVIAALKKADFLKYSHDYLGNCTLVVTNISGGTALNAVPGKCIFKTDIRIVPGQTVAGVTAEMQEMLNRLMSEDKDLHVELEILPNAVKDIIEIPEEEKVVQTAVQAMQDVLGKAEFMPGVESPGAVTYFTQAGIPAIFFGPGSIWDAHVPNESIEISRLGEMAGIYALAALHYLGVED